MSKIELEVEGFDEAEELVAELKDKAEEAVEKGNEDLAKAIYNESQTLVPVDTGRLKRSGEIRQRTNSISILYTAPYAIWVHERVELSHDNGQAKFLEEPAKKLKKKADRFYYNHLFGFL